LCSGFRVRVRVRVSVRVRVRVRVRARARARARVRRAHRWWRRRKFLAPKSQLTVFHQDWGRRIGTIT
jgi:hypothetical protein